MSQTYVPTPILSSLYKDAQARLDACIAEFEDTQNSADLEYITVIHDIYLRNGFAVGPLPAHIYTAAVIEGFIE